MNPLAWIVVGAIVIPGGLALLIWLLGGFKPKPPDFTGV